MSENGKEISRRQFLTYTIMGVGGFLAATPLIPMVRFAVDPALQAATEGADDDMVPVMDVSEITNEPKSVNFKLETVDGWYETEAALTAWVYKEGDQILAMSPICTHLGCSVQWNTRPEHPEHFFCPCHYGLYTKDGTNVPGTPPKEPLHLYKQEIRDGKLYLGRAEARGKA